METHYINSKNNICDCGTILDQRQDQCNYGIYIYEGIYSYYAQAFRPTLSTLAEIRLGMWKIGDPNDYNLTLSIRKTLDGVDIVSKSISGSVVTSNSEWISFEFEIIDLTPGETYYMVLGGDGGNQGACYLWCCYAGDEDRYPYGKSWDNSFMGQWTITYIQGYPFFDFCF